MWEIKLLHKTTYRKLPTLLSCREYCSSSLLASVKQKEISKSIQVTCSAKPQPTILCKSNANDNRQKKRLFWSLAIYCRYISETFHGYDKSARYPYNLRDISWRYRSSETSLQQYLAKQTVYRCSEVRCIKQYVVVNYTSTIYRNEAIVFDESVFVYM